jgi:hypothetical protein
LRRLCILRPVSLRNKLVHALPRSCPNVFKKSLSGILGFILVAAFTSPSRADTYQVFNIGNANVGAPFGIDDAGTVPVFVRCMSAVCLDFYPAGIFVKEVAYSSIPDPAPFHFDNGTPCKPFPAATIGSCNNGHVVYLGYFDNPFRRGVYVGPDPTTDRIGGEGDLFYINALGDSTWIDGSTETIWEAVDLTSREAPEPSSIILIATAGIALAGAFRRRRLDAVRIVTF